jgi:hypothetical protein
MTIGCNLDVVTFNMYILIQHCTRPYTIVHHSTLLYTMYTIVYKCAFIYSVIPSCTILSTTYMSVYHYTLLYINVHTYPMVAPEHILLCEGMGTRRENSSLRLWLVLFFLNCFLNLNKFWIRNFKIVIWKVKKSFFLFLCVVEVLFDYCLVLF